MHIFIISLDAKRIFFKVTVPLYLIFSTPQPINLDKEKELSKKQYFVVGLGGILINSIFGFIGIIIVKNIKIEPDNLFHFFWYSFSLFHFIEAASYTVLNNIIVASDIVTIQNYKPIYRIPLFLIGLFYVYFILDLINNSPQIWRLGLIIITCILALLMGVLRVIFSHIMNKKM